MYGTQTNKHVSVFSPAKLLSVHSQKLRVLEVNKVNSSNDYSYGSRIKSCKQSRRLSKFAGLCLAESNGKCCSAELSVDKVASDPNRRS